MHLQQKLPSITGICDNDGYGTVTIWSGIMACDVILRMFKFSNTDDEDF